ncbi:MAG: VWA domain-containing protein, partial [Acidobacteria bacterium]|nr:VWA domain-containing protein [Acidobacteriota bacterium]
MKKHSSLALMLILILVTPLFAQTPTPQDEQIKDEDVVRITTNLIQVDAVVVDKDGRQVKDLRPDEFEVYEDGHLQQITNFSYISLEAENVAQSPAPPARSKTPAPPAQVRAADARRVVVMVVDDLALSMESTIYVRRAIRKFVDEQMQPGDLVAIAHTAGDAGA